MSLTVEQLQINFSRQNTRENQAILEGNKERLSRQCVMVLEAMLRGEKLTTASALMKYSIGDLRARCRDLIRSGIEITKELKEDRFKLYYMTEEQINNFIETSKYLTSK